MVPRPALLPATGRRASRSPTADSAPPRPSAPRSPRHLAGSPAPEAVVRRTRACQSVPKLPADAQRIPRGVPVLPPREPEQRSRVVDGELVRQCSACEAPPVFHRDAMRLLPSKTIRIENVAERIDATCDEGRRLVVVAAAHRARVTAAARLPERDCPARGVSGCLVPCVFNTRLTLADRPTTRRRDVHVRQEESSVRSVIRWTAKRPAQRLLTSLRGDADPHWREVNPSPRPHLFRPCRSVALDGGHSSRTIPPAAHVPHVAHAERIINWSNPC